VTAPLLAAAGLAKRFGAQIAVADLDLEVAPGEIVGLAGRNGAGKSTTLGMLAGIVPPDSGSVTLSGERLTRDRRELRRSIGLVPQEAAVYPELSADENLACFGGLYGLSGAALRRRGDEVLDLVGLTAVAQRPAGQLSGGMRRRLSLAVALLHRPRLLLLDEPGVGLDLEFRPRLAEIVRSLTRDGGAAVWSAHDLAGAEAVWSSVVVLDRGRVVAHESVRELVPAGGAAVPQPAALEVALRALLQTDGSGP
jgi:ABC-2 type transport system ATP-binding protein